MTKRRLPGKWGTVESIHGRIWMMRRLGISRWTLARWARGVTKPSGTAEILIGEMFSQCGIAGENADSD